MDRSAGAMSINHSILTLITFIPALGALLLVVMPRGVRHRDAGAHSHSNPSDNNLKWVALIVSLVAFVASLHLPFNFNYHLSGFQPAFEVNHVWITTPNIHYHLGVDGISMWLVILTTFLVPLSIICQWNSIHGRVKEFLILLLLQETAMIGVFLALDLFLFYVFWEATLIPMALLIGVYGHGRRIYAAVKFFLYTMIASVFMLAAILWLYAKTGSFDFVTIQNAIRSGGVSDFAAAAQWLFLGFFIAFAVKVPLF